MGNFNSPDNLRSAMEAWKFWSLALTKGTLNLDNHPCKG